MLDKIKYSLTISLSIILQIGVVWDVILRTVNLLTLTLWILSIFLLYVSFPSNKSGRKNTNTKNFNKLLPAVLIIIIALLIRFNFMTDDSRFHGDEYLTAYFSYSLENFSKIDWFGVYPEKGVWVSQFPVLYFLIQKVFLTAFKVSTLVMRISTLPYLFLTFITLFLIARQLYGNTVAYVSIILLTLFSPDLYLSRWALHFISSTALFLLTTYFFILSYKFGNKLYFALTGIFMGLSYMTYYSSYLIAPLLFVYLTLLVIKREIIFSSLKKYILTFFIFVYTISPLTTYAVFVDNYLVQRTDQVDLLNGLWSPYKAIEKTPEAIVSIIFNQLKVSISSLYKDGEGGHGGYYFGHLSLFDSLSFLFFVISVSYFLIRVYKKDPDSTFIIITIFCVFITGMVLTIPPPAFHRVSLAYPFISLVIAKTVFDIYKFLNKNNIKNAKLILYFSVLGILSTNIVHFRKVLKSETLSQSDYPKIEKDLTLFPGNKVYIAAFESYALGKVLFIRSGGNTRFATQPLDVILNVIPKGDSSPLVILYPEEESFNKVISKYPNSKIVRRYQSHLLISVN
ncbi:hypothetical protein A2714_02710 [Candidatus Woesebacteria bacterium RIFCSPHIGHO2_01_FULL_38_9]|uniref:Glycosyltransferase RgtA/B/C/D-like domain-containing protein n=2 Tax=Candidatus Woeseibacteriota TaxID=1752722 RepID=A0A1F7Y369_9BACT|nr:MAG: hypothetical protein A2714_02710 [Candidatus Woesebacteria bacterium RIFCSPHIGHO2_01_FULL_38_9]OGM59685.1 MAG: hypothetical protein A3A75_00880 [Candidatus Woesebacteria bacterium RIFCSPLOWO2_01_FULL_39_10]